MRKLMGVVSAFMLIGFAGLVSAANQTIDFAGLTIPGGISSSFQWNGFQFTVTGGSQPYMQQSSGIRFGTVAPNENITMTVRRVDSSDFTLVSVRGLGLDENSGVTITALNNGGTVGTGSFPANPSNNTTTTTANFGSIVVDEFRLSGQTSAAFAGGGELYDFVISVSNLPPTLNSYAGTRSYTTGGSAITLDGGTAATVVDSDSADFNGGYVLVSGFSGEVATEDNLQVGNVGTIGVNLGTGEVTDSGVAIGQVVLNGQSGADLRVNLNANATVARVQNLIRALQYYNSELTSPYIQSRVLQTMVSDGDGAAPVTYNTTINYVLPADPVGSQKVTFNSGTTVPDIASNVPTSFTSQGFTFSVSGGFGAYFQSGSDFPGSPGVNMGTTGGGTITATIGRTAAGTDFSLGSLVFGSTITSNATVEVRLNGSSLATRTIPGGYAQRLDFGGITVDEIRISGNSSNSGFFRVGAFDELIYFPANLSPTVGNMQGDTSTYTQGDASVNLDTSTAATLSDTDSPDFNGGNLTLAIVQNKWSTQDVLQIGNIGSITTSGNNVLENGTNIGTITGNGTGANNLVVSFNANATPARIQSLLRALQYRNTEANQPDLGDRILQLTLIDGDGSSPSETSLTVRVRPSALPAGRVVDLNYTGLPQQPVNTVQVDYQSYRAIITGGFQRYLQNSFDGPSPPALYGGDTGISSQSISLQRVDGADFFGYAIIVGNFNSAVALTLQTRNNGSVVQSLSVPGGGTQRVLLNDTLAIDQIVFSGSVSSTNGRFAFIDELAVKPPNTPPTVGGTGSNMAYTENQAATAIDSGFTVTDPDNNFNGGSLRIQITGNATASDLLSVVNVGGVALSGSNVQISGVTKGTISAPVVTGGTAMTITFNGSATTADVQTITRAIGYANNSESPPTTVRTVTFRVTDAATTFAERTRQINVTAVNDLPTVSGAATLNYTENQASSPVNSILTVNDLDHSSLASATVSISTGYVNGQDILAFTANPGTMGNISGSFAPATGVLSLSSAGATATLTQWQTALINVLYQNLSDAPSTTPRTVSMVLNDGVGPGTALNNTINVIAQNDLPVLSNTSAVSYIEDGAPVVINALVTIADIDHATLASASISVAANFAAGQDVLGFTANPASMGNISGTYAPASGVLSLNSAGATATLAQWQEALRAVTYQNSSGNPSTAARGIAFAVNDGQGLSIALMSSVAVTAINDAPSLNSNTSSVTFTEDGPAIAVNPTLQVSDVDNPTLASATVTLTNLNASEDSLVLPVNPATMGNIVASYNPVSGVMQLDSAGAAATLAQWQAALRAVAYTNNSNSPGSAVRSISVLTHDGSLDSLAQVSTINVVPVNDPPVLVNGTAISFTEGDSPVLVNTVLNVSDPDHSTLASARVAISGGFAGAEDVLSFSSDGLSMGNISGSYDAGSGVLNLTSAGASASLSQWQAALRAVRYQNVSDNPSTTTRTLSLSANDGVDAGIALAGSVMVVAVNDPPVLQNGSSVSYTENALPLPINSLLALSDLDNSTLSSATVTILGGHVASEDVLALLPNPLTMGNISASFAPATGTLTLNSAGATATLAQWLNALHAVTYFNSSDNPSTTSRTVQFVVNDGTDVAPPVSSQVSLLAENDAPMLGSASSVSFTENGSALPVNPSITVADADDTILTTATVTITQNLHPAEDRLSLPPGVPASGGVLASYDEASGTLSLSSSSGTTTVADWQSVLRAVAYQNLSDDPNTAARDIRFTVRDAALPSAPLTSALAVVASNDPPVLQGSSAVSFTENGSPVVIHSTVGLADVDNSTQASASISIGAGFAAGDTLAFSNDGVSMGNIVGNLVGNVLSLSSAGASASVSEWQSALRAVTFATSSDAPSTSNRSVTMVIHDGQADSEPVTSIISVLGINDAPGLSVPSGLTVNEDALSTLGPIDIQDPDVGTGMMQVQISATAGQLLASAGTGVAITGSPGATITAEGTRTDLVSWLSGAALQFIPTADFFGSTSVSLMVSDLGNSPGPAATGSAVVPVQVTAIPDADVSAVLSNEQSIVWVGDTVIYSAVLKNAGPEAVSLSDGLRAQFPVPSGLSGVAWTCEGSEGGVCGNSGAGAIDDAVGLPVGASVTYMITATVDASVASGTLSAAFGYVANPALQSDLLSNNLSMDSDEVRLFRNGFE